jgi:putative ABC transport system permease protein
LLAPGTLFAGKYRLDLPEGTPIWRTSPRGPGRFADTGMRWRDARNGAPGVAEFVDRLGAFLILVGLSGLAVGGVGVSAAVRAYLASKTEVIATLRTLGADRATIFQTYFIQIGLLTILGIAIGLVLGALAPLVLAPLIEARLPIPAAFAHLSRPAGRGRALWRADGADLHALAAGPHRGGARRHAVPRRAVHRRVLLPRPATWSPSALAAGLR